MTDRERSGNRGSRAEVKIDREILCDYVAKILTDQETIKRIDQARAVTGSWVQRTVDEIYEKLADPLNVDFGKVAADREHPGGRDS